MKYPEEWITDLELFMSNLNILGADIYYVEMTAHIIPSLSKEQKNILENL